MLLNAKEQLSVLEHLVGSSNTSFITVCGIDTCGLIDTGSMITTISEDFYHSIHNKPVLHDISEFGLSVEGATGVQIPYIGFIEAEISVPFLGDGTFCIPLLVNHIQLITIRKSLLLLEQI